ncbi:MAG: rRNA maturation RNase YbeY [Lunatimonas sp.]|uniref:rRNA maturation RNase YbeY n=1 Tax=Lunatimonas sp. TaxID=2060141 RepID=UPI00263AE45A|nr:rRNA maturation RNase YbeY [Lunatimonas sp.]MCC5937433.1 rRNA maturation RNase YbeY [Lunatimonas sp.]
MAILFFEEDTSFRLTKKNRYKKWLHAVATSEGQKITELLYIFCSDEYLHQINLTYLDHDTYTDIITFDQSETKNTIEGEIYVSIDRVQENATHLNQSFDRELRRVISHGLLHLCGYKDKTATEAAKMRKKEEAAIELFEAVG